MPQDLEHWLRQARPEQIIKHLLTRIPLAQIFEMLRSSGEYRLRESVYQELGKNLASHAPGIPSGALAAALASLIEHRPPTEEAALSWLRQALLKITVSYRRHASKKYEREIHCWLRDGENAGKVRQIRSSTDVSWEELPEEFRDSFIRLESTQEEFLLFSLANQTRKG